MALQIIKHLNMAHKPQPFRQLKQTIPDGRVWVFVSGYESPVGTPRTERLGCVGQIGPGCKNENASVGGWNRSFVFRDWTERAVKRKAFIQTAALFAAPSKCGGVQRRRAPTALRWREPKWSRHIWETPRDLGDLEWRLAQQLRRQPGGSGRDRKASRIANQKLAVSVLNKTSDFDI